MSCSERFRVMASMEAARFAAFTNSLAAMRERFPNHLAFTCLKTVLALLDFFGEGVDLICMEDRLGFIRVASFSVSGVRASAPDFIPSATPTDGRRPPQPGEET